MATRRLVFVSLAAVALGVACAPSSQDDTAEVVADGSDSASVEAATSLVVAPILTGSAGTLDLGAAGVPPGCLTVSGGVYTFQSCAAPYSVGGPIDGTVAVNKSTDGAVLHLDISSTKLTLGHVSVSKWVASADITAADNDRTMIWQSHIEGTTSVRGFTRSFSRDVGSSTIRWTVGLPCVSIDGSSAGTFESSKGTVRTIAVSLVGFRRCGGGCPEAGSTVSIDASNRRPIEIRYLVGDRATYTDALGGQVPFIPLCAL